MYLFYSDYLKIGGVENLIINISSFLFFERNQSVKVICYRDSFLFQKLAERKIDFQYLDIESNTWDSSIHDKDILIRTDFGNLNKFQKLNCRMIYWEVLPSILANAVSTEFLISKAALLYFVGKKNGLCFMDYNSFIELGKMGYKTIKKSILPIPINKNEIINKKDSSEPIHNLSYIGRDVSWKIFPLVKVISDLSQMKERNFHLNIYCDSNRVFNQLITDNLENVKISYHLNFTGAVLRNHLIANSDLHFAMGTSALEGAILGIPTVVLDYSEQAFPSAYKYQFIFETLGYSLGRPITVNDSFKGVDLTEIINVIDDDISGRIAKLCHDYTLEKHEISKIVNELEVLTSKCKVSCRKFYFFWKLMCYEKKIRDRLLFRRF